MQRFIYMKKSLVNIYCYYIRQIFRFSQYQYINLPSSFLMFFSLRVLQLFLRQNLISQLTLASPTSPIQSYNSRTLSLALPNLGIGALPLAQVELHLPVSMKMTPQKVMLKDYFSFYLSQHYFTSTASFLYIQCSLFIGSKRDREIRLILAVRIHGRGRGKAWLKIREKHVNYSTLSLSSINWMQLKN